MKHFSLLLLQLYSLSTAAQQTWSKAYNVCADTPSAGRAVLMHADEDFFISAGYANEFGQEPRNIYLARIDYNGQLVSKKFIDFAGSYNVLTGYELGQQTNPLIKAGTNRYLLAAADMDVQANTKIEVYQPFFYFFDEHCDSLRFVQYKDTLVSRLPYSVARDVQGNLVVTGVISSEQIHLGGGGDHYWDSTYIWLAKFDGNGNQLWSKQLFAGHNFAGVPKQGMSNGRKVIMGSDGQSYIVAGSCLNEAAGYHDAFIMKTDLDGNVVWRKFLPRNQASYNDIDIVALQDGNYAFISSEGSLYSAFYYGKVDNGGNFLWTRTFQRYNTGNRGKRIFETKNGDLVFWGETPHYKHRYAVISTLNDGQVKWYREHFHVDTSYPDYWHIATNMTVTPNDRVLIAGLFGSAAITPGVFDSTGNFAWHVLTDSLGCISSGCNGEDTMWHTSIKTLAEKVLAPVINIYPNPTAGSFSFSSSEPGILLLYSIEGQKIAGYTINKRDNALGFPGSAPAGIYIGRFISSSGNSYTLRISHQP